MGTLLKNHMSISESFKKMLPHNVVLSIMGGTIIIVFWVYINQLNAEGQLPFWDILDFANENQAETALENQNVNTQTTTQQTTRLGPYKDGIYQASSDIPWGTLTIEITVKNGQWSNIKPIAIPDSPPSIYAASYLARQALQAQNDSIDGVSGATYTSNGFRDDLRQIIAQSK